MLFSPFGHRAPPCRGTLRQPGRAAAAPCDIDSRSRRREFRGGAGRRRTRSSLSESTAARTRGTSPFDRSHRSPARERLPRHALERVPREPR
ncbi:hypothetical protein SGRIM128S_08728 [Streptomyces griseomycini]